MQTTKNLSARLREDLIAFIGTETWHRHPLNRSMLLTDGVVYFADQAGAWWLLDIAATEIFQMQASQAFLVIDLDVASDKANIRVSDGDDNQIYRRHIHITDAPAGTWRFFLTDNVMLLPSEY